MAENIALETTSAKKFHKSVKGIHKLLKSGVIELPKNKDSTRSEPKKSTRGLVYIGHIPHGFYEEQMRGYFGQFGTVTNAKVAMSAKTGRSKGYGFVEFVEPEVAKIVAETMNNYLMGKRLLKAQYIAPENNRFLTWKRNWNTKSAPGVLNRIKARKEFNNAANADNGLKQARNILKSLKKTKKMLQSHGIDYNSFEPHDVPEELKTDQHTESEEITSKKTLKMKDSEIETKKDKKVTPKLKKTELKELKEKIKKDKTKKKMDKSELENCGDLSTQKSVKSGETQKERSKKLFLQWQSWGAGKKAKKGKK